MYLTLAFEGIYILIQIICIHKSHTYLYIYLFIYLFMVIQIMCLHDSRKPTCVESNKNAIVSQRWQVYSAYVYHISYMYILYSTNHQPTVNKRVYPVNARKSKSCNLYNCYSPLSYAHSKYHHHLYHYFVHSPMQSTANMFKNQNVKH
jgi:hypothetical protein